MSTDINQNLAKVNAVIRSLSDIPAKKRRKLLLGSLMARLFPGRAKKLEVNAVNKSWGAFDRMLRNGLLAKAYWAGDHAKQRALFSHYWAQEADDVAHVWQDRFEREFLGHNVVIIDALEEVIQGKDFTQLYEIGCGHGQVLEYLVNRISSIEQFVGIDISEEQTKKNNANYSHPKMTFHGADAVEWVIYNGKKQSVFLTNGGVFEYFLQSELETMFKHIAKNLTPAVVGVVETLGSDHNLEKEKDSLIYGRELAFSHNYPHLLREAGFEIKHHSEQVGAETHGGGRWIRVLAYKGQT